MPLAYYTIFIGLPQMTLAKPQKQAHTCTALVVELKVDAMLHVTQYKLVLLTSVFLQI